jgi:hypothetical protein
MNFMRGNQMIVHDPRLNDPGDSEAEPPRPSSNLRPPSAKNVWTVSRSDTAEHILDWCGTVARAWGTMDALHFMAHGNKGMLEIGADNLSDGNVDLFTKLNGHVKYIVFFACLVGGELGDLAECSTVIRVFGQRVAEKSGAKVIACNLEQVYHWSFKKKIIDFGDFEGDIFVIYPEGCFDLYNTDAGQPLHLEHLIFPPEEADNSDREGGGSGRGA